METTTTIALGLLALAYFGRRIIKRLLGKAARTRRRLARQERTLIRDVTDGYVRICGHAKVLGELVEAPLTRRPCMAYEVLIEGFGERAKPSTPVQRELRPFFVVDESGEALINPDGPFVLALVPHRRGRTGFFGSPRKAELQALKSFTNADDEEPGSFTYSESVLPPDGMVSVAGIAMREVTPDAERSAPRQPPERVVLRGTADHPLLIGPWSVGGT